MDLKLERRIANTGEFLEGGWGCLWEMISECRQAPRLTMRLVMEVIIFWKRLHFKMKDMEASRLFRQNNQERVLFPINPAGVSFLEDDTFAFRACVRTCPNYEIFTEIFGPHGEGENLSTVFSASSTSVTSPYRPTVDLVIIDD